LNEKKKKGEVVDDAAEEQIKLQQTIVLTHANETIPHPIQLNLRDINFSLPRGTCTAVIGKVGSGKSSLLSAILGELYHLPGSSIKIDKKIAYVPQQSWTLSKTIKENILMGKKYDEDKFQESLKFSCLLEDLKYMPYREQTLIGNKGINLSGGQRARLSIARALYSDSDVYLLDDPISALDINVGKSIMEQTILKHLRGKTTLVATHALAYLPYFDNIFVIDGGSIILQGKYDKLLENQKFKDIYQDLAK
jgi:ATP-binding cassette subfamily C (CFTR/MRP) protein 2